MEPRSQKYLFTIIMTKNQLYSVKITKLNENVTQSFLDGLLLWSAQLKIVKRLLKKSQTVLQHYINSKATYTQY